MKREKGVVDIRRKITAHADLHSRIDYDILYAAVKNT
jgi:hypothetical protein